MNQFTSDSTPTRITRDVIAQVPDDELALYLYDFVLTVFKKHGVFTEHEELSEAETLDLLPHGLRAVYLLTVLEGEIYNGGCGQYYGNNGDGFADEAAELLELIGASMKAQVTREATLLYREKFMHQSDDEISDATYDELGDLTSRYYDLEHQEDIGPLLAAYVRKDPALVEYDNSK